MRSDTGLTAASPSASAFSFSHCSFPVIPSLPLYHSPPPSRTLSLPPWSASPASRAALALNTQLKGCPDAWLPLLTGGVASVLQKQAGACPPGERKPLTERHCTGLRMLYRDAFRPLPAKTKGWKELVSAPTSPSHGRHHNHTTTPHTITSTAHFSWCIYRNSRVVTSPMTH